MAVKDSLGKLVEVSTLQNDKIDKLLALENNIKSLVQAIDFTPNTSNDSSLGKRRIKLVTTIVLSSTCAIIIGTCVIFILKSFNIL